MLPGDRNDRLAALCQEYYSLKNKAFYSRMSFAERLDAARDITDGLKENDYYFYRRTVNDFPSPEDTSSSSMPPKRLINLASNDYLGFTKHPAIIRAGSNALQRWGAGTGSVPMLAGTTPVHQALEQELADFIAFESVLTFNSGYAANEGLLTSLLTPADVAILDMAVHASIIDGCVHTNIIYFKHNDPLSLKIALRKAEVYCNKLVVVDGVFSMDGDITPLPEILPLVKDHNAWLLIDESHALGVIGENGRGTHSYYEMKIQADIVSCSMGKALGGIGGFIAGPSSLIKLIELTSRPYLFSTSIPQNIAAQLREAIRILQTDTSVFQKLRMNIRYFKKRLDQIGFESPSSDTAILPVIIRDEIKLLNFCRILHGDGVFVNPIFYPVVQKKKSRIRVSVTADLETTELDYALERMQVAAHQTGIL